MLTVKDIKKLIDVFVTREELKEALDKLASKDEMRKVMGMVEKIYGEVKNMREEQSIHAQRQLF